MTSQWNYRKRTRKKIARPEPQKLSLTGATASVKSNRRRNYCNVNWLVGSSALRHFRRTHRRKQKLRRHAWKSFVMYRSSFVKSVQRSNVTWSGGVSALSRQRRRYG